MICSNCKEAFNGSTGICHVCGTSVLIEKVKVQNEEVNISEPDPIPKKNIKPIAKKEATKKK